MSDILYSPWRLKYILSAKNDQCIFCLRPSAEADEKQFILYRSQHSFVIMNMFPYNNGHLMAVPFRHVCRLNDLDSEEIGDLFSTVRLCEKVLQNVYNPDGLNVGINLGRAAGAGIDTHLHVHVIPRWNGDVNFMTVVNGTRIIPEAFERAYHQLKEQFDSLKDEK
ncbi:MAG TPA: HIT domain-containing protein [Candidatus Cloacimonadota bacterium]|nr:HIT domain-containing protein [Candidatus Cloacimonadota bacterium]